MASPSHFTPHPPPSGSVQDGDAQAGGQQVPVLVLVVTALAACISSSESLFPTATRGKGGGGKKDNPQHRVLQCRTARGKTALDILYRDTRLSQHHLVMPWRYWRKQENRNKTVPSGTHLFAPEGAFLWSACTRSWHTPSPAAVLRLSFPRLCFYFLPF